MTYIFFRTTLCLENLTWPDKRWKKVVTTRPSKSIPGDDPDESPKKLQSICNGGSSGQAGRLE
jgi:hypothetical protein